ncbi:MAG: hypothetical protein KGS72_12890 [Cyanobacteria bacterium REEB67]|nr:hypothetical protein [Cyanobacteria bacterium REEB67]
MRDKIVAGLLIVMIAGIFFMGGGGKEKANHRFMGAGGDGQRQGQSADDGGSADQSGEQGAEQGHSLGQGQGQDQGQGQGQNQAQGMAQNGNPAAGSAQNQTLTQQMQRSMNPGGQPLQQNSTSSVASLPPSLAVDFVRWWLTMALDYSLNTSAANHKKALAYAKPQVANMFKQSFYTSEVMQGVAAGTLAGSFQPVTVQAIAINPDGSVVVTVIGNLTLQSSGSQPVSQSLDMEFLVTKDAQGVRMAGFFNKTVTQPPPAAAGDQGAGEVLEEPTRRRPLSGGY